MTVEAAITFPHRTAVSVWTVLAKVRETGLCAAFTKLRRCALMKGDAVKTRVTTNALE